MTVEERFTDAVIAALVAERERIAREIEELLGNHGPRLDTPEDAIRCAAYVASARNTT